MTEKIIKSGIENIYFAWVGSNDGNHIHAILREKGSDFWENILKNHYLETKHYMSMVVISDFSTLPLYCAN